MSYQILLADDEGEHWRQVIDLGLEGDGDITVAQSPATCRAKVRSGKFDLLILDINFGSGEESGFVLLQELRALYPDLDIVVLSGLDDSTSIIRARKFGAKDFVCKSRHQVQEIGIRLKAVLEAKEAEEESAEDHKKIAAMADAAYSSAKMAKVFAKAAVARDVPTLDVLITGRAGVGKEVIARAVHQGRPNAPFVSINCGAIPETLIEGELFGHVRGSYTGAHADRKGHFETAHGGDIFLDEVGCLASATQIALLRVLENREVIRIGSTKAIPITVRVIAATNDDLRAKVEDGTFRRDLLSRLEGFEIRIPPLCERKEDIKPIVHHVIAKSKKPNLKIDPGLLEVLENYSWPENVRELKRRLDAMIAVAKGSVITMGDLPDEFVDKLELNSSESPQATDDESYCHLSLPLSLSLEEAKKQFIVQFVKLKSARLGPSVSYRKLADSLKIPKTTLLRNLDIFGLSSHSSSGKKNQEGTTSKSVRTP